MSISDRGSVIKKLLYQSSNRGCKETDVILGNFAKLHLAEMTDQELKTFEKILYLPDADIYDWYMKKKPVPVENCSKIMTQILNFKP